MTAEPVWRIEDDCFVHDRDRLTYDQAIDILRTRLGPLVERIDVDLTDAVGRIAAQPLTAARPIPAFDNSAVDGYAFAFDTLAEADTATQLQVSSRVAAGAQQEHPVLQQGTAARIFTGAVMPKGADTVVMQEDCRVSEDGMTVLIPAGARPGSNIRKMGEDLNPGDGLVSKGEVLNPRDIARLASAGVSEVPVFKRLKVGLLSSGDELRAPGQELPPGAVFDANAPMLIAMAKNMPVELHFLGTMADEESEVETALASAAERFDVILTSGGASKGDADHLQTVLNRLGKSHIWQLAIKPGRPMMMGQIGQVPVFALPGNPVAVFICWCLFVHPALLHMAGATWPEPQRITVPAGFEVTKKKPDRRELYRGWLENRDGVTTAIKFQRDGSGLISGLQAATGLIEIPEEATSVAPGDLVRFWPLSQFSAP
ncbi:MAG: gephyrin-like molybdotransferase Glp [Pseudomonadota bacterium]